MLEYSENQRSAAVEISKADRETEKKPVTAPLRPSPPNSEKRAAKRLGKYEFSMDQRLGSGMSGDAYIGMDTETYELVCVKVIDRAIFKTPQQKLLLENEIRCQSACSSAFTIKILDVFDTPSFCFIVTEFCQGGDLYKLLKTSCQGLPEPLVICFGHQIATAMAKLKEANVVHRDIKSENILIQKGQCKLGDFGFAVEQSKLGQQKFNLGSPLYMSLQALEKSEYSFASDIFAFGVVLFEMIHKQSPWECSQEQQLIARMKVQQPSIKSGVSESMKSLILNCLKRNPQERLTIQQILTHEVFKDIELLQ